jgi:hypothetical protein
MARRRTKPSNGKLQRELRFKRMTDLARHLQKQFHRRINIVISPQQVNHWRTGSQLPTIVKDGQPMKPPLFPDRTAKGFNAKECEKWVEEWILPGHSESGNGHGNFDLETKRHKLWLMAKEKGEVEAAFKAKYDDDLSDIGRTINQTITETGEKTLSWAVEDLIARTVTDETQKRTLLDGLKKCCQDAADKLRETIKESLLK